MTLVCKKCGLIKERFDFAHEKKNGKVYRRLVCQSCRSKYKRRHKAHGLDKPSRQRRRQQAAELVDSHKRGPCKDCGKCFPTVAMDFDHVRGSKVKSIGLMVGDGSSLEAILAEIDKCDLVCANCHRIRTAKRAGWRGTTLQPGVI